MRPVASPTSYLYTLIMQITPYKNSDAKAVATFFRSVFAEMGWSERASDHMDTPHVLFHLPDHGALMLVKEDDRVVGTAGIILRTKTEGLIKRFYLEKTHRGTGAAQPLLHALIKLALSRGVTKLVLDVSKNNARAIRFYEKNGFQKTSVTPQDNWPESHMPDTHYFFYKQIVSNDTYEHCSQDPSKYE
jgi:RimJ/RimL family protein N-acetyltransferase